MALESSEVISLYYLIQVRDYKVRLVASAVVSQVMGKGSDDDHQVALSELPDVGTHGVL